MKRIVVAIAVWSILFSFIACSAKKPPEPAAVRTKSTLSALRDLCRAYESRDLPAFMAALAPTYPDREVFGKNISAVFAKYDTIQFTPQYTKMVIMIDTTGRAKAIFTWEAEWKTAGGLSVKDGARGTLVFDQKDNKLLAVEGKNPFIPQPGTTPGKEAK
ncbi:MAG TPA: hypothetical protein VK654_16555 [Nitrospirota bacterium]|nr:hypothetical protein [Nitrospirota bacterium]